MQKNKGQFYEFLPDVLEITEKPTSPLGRLTIWLIFIAVIVLILWSYLGKIDVVATTTGKIVPDGNVKVVQSIAEGKITQILVEDGQYVEKDTPLILIDTSLNQVDNTTYSKQLNKARFEKMIIEDILTNNEITLKDVNEENIQILTYYKAKRENYKTSLELFDTQVLQTEASVETTNLQVSQAKENIKNLEKQIKDLNKEINQKSSEEQILDTINVKLDTLIEQENNSKKLLDQGVITQNEYAEIKKNLEITQSEYNTQKINVENKKLEDKRKLINLNNQKDNLTYELGILNSKILEIKSQKDKILQEKINFISEDRKNLQNTILEIDKVIMQNEGEIAKSDTIINYNQLTAPVSGKISGISVNTIGSVVKPADTLLTIVPDGTELIAETFLLNKDSGFVKLDQETMIKVDAYPFQKFRTIKGKIIYISPNSYPDEKLGNVYLVKIKLEKDYLESEGVQYKISSGMQVKAEIKTGERRILDFFLEPIVKYLDESIKIR